MTLIDLVIWTTAGIIDDGPKWTFLTCQEVIAYAEGVLSQYGGQYELRCEEFVPFHEVDFPPLSSDSPNYE